ncbi:putative PITH domain-containing protein 1-like [Trypanosoma conorhini]|uniref:Putative PITH domain-containing protein 1-like n=1 Tax=Trypanosoma conorhini TaxID=83891 RepID=A0A422PDK9_9TRYP|nr:putative PITH domain-containing protein 1-like [Trypanosoma conorhini]RNF15807.1 putative PITH domain-containing protein 1-like [Trypanosoma conorhini]
MPCNCRHGTGSHDHLRDGFLQGGVLGIGSPLNEQVDLPFLQLWNARHSASEAARLFDPKMEDNQEPICSDADPELLFLVPLKQVCRVRGISILGTNDDFSPAEVKLFCNPTDVVGFDSVRRLQPQEEVQLAQVPEGDRIVYRLNPAKFSNCSSLGLFFERSFGEDETHLLRIDLFGESTGRSVHQELATNIVYEAQANPADHKVADERLKPFTVL